MSRARVFIATSLDGFIAGPDNDLSWLPEPSGVEGEDNGYGKFMAEVGALLMGRSTFDVVSAFGGSWPYGELPVHVASTRPLESKVETVVPVKGTIESLVQGAKEAAGEQDVYIDGGRLIRQCLDAGLIDEIILTIVPVILGEGIPLFAGALHRQKLVLSHSETLGGGLVQLTYKLAD